MFNNFQYFLKDLIIVFFSSILLSSCSSVGSSVKSNLGETISDKSVLMAKFKQNKGMLDTSALNLASPTLRKDRAVVLVAVRQDGDALQYADAVLRKNKQVVLTAVMSLGYGLKYADLSLKKDRQIALAAARDNHQAIKYFDASLLQDKAFMQKVNSN